VILTPNVAAAAQHFASLVVAYFITEWADGWLVSRDLKKFYGTRNPSPDDPGMGFLLGAANVESIESCNHHST
jgi:hypothetical protein